MIILIAGPSHTGKTALAQRLLETLRYPYLSIDLLKMGLIRSGQTALTPEDDVQLTAYLWPIVREILRTALENRQNLIVEGCYIPFDWYKDFDAQALAQIRHYRLIMTQAYIERHFDDIVRHANAVEWRAGDPLCSRDFLLADNRRELELSRRYPCNRILIDGAYRVEADPDAFLTSERLAYRRMSERDFPALCRMLQDPQVMYAWEHAFSDDEVRAWLDRRRAGYAARGYDYFLAVDPSTGEAVGQIGLLDEEIDGRHFVGLGYILCRDAWGRGYATEGARTMLQYAFEALGAEEVVATIRPENTASRRVAQRLGMALEGEYVKRYRGRDMVHLIYRARR